MIIIFEFSQPSPLRIFFSIIFVYCVFPHPYVQEREREREREKKERKKERKPIVLRFPDPGPLEEYRIPNEMNS